MIISSNWTAVCRRTRSWGESLISSGHGHDRTRTGFHPKRLIVRRPIHQELEPRLREEIGRDMALRHPGAHPAARPLAAVAVDLVPDIGDEAGLVLFPELALALGIGAAVANDLVPARLDGAQDLRGVIENRGVHEVSSRQAELIEEIEDAPHADAVAIIAPGEGARVRRRQLGGHGMAEPVPKAKCSILRPI
jgi:hypothetical protein